MKRRILHLAVLIVALQGTTLAQHHHSGDWTSSKKNPAFAALLSLQPLPVDCGSFYAGNWERGIAYTVAEVALFVPAMMTLSRDSHSWGHHWYGGPSYTDGDRRGWTPAERQRFYILLSGYVLVKAISAFDAGYTVEQQNAAMMLGYDEGTKSVALSFSVRIN